MRRWLLAWMAALVAGSLHAQDAPRWVSAGGAISEWVVALGGESRLVGVDSTSLHLQSLAQRPNIGYQRQLAAEGILALRPQVLLGTEEMGPPPVLQQLKAAGVQIEVLSARADLQTLQGNLQRLGLLLGDASAAEQAWQRFSHDLQEQAEAIRQAQQHQQAPRVLMLLGHAGASPLIAGRDTSAVWLIEQAGGVSPVAHQGYKPLSSEALLGLDVDVLLVADRRLQGDAAIAALLAQNPALEQLRAVREQRVSSLDPSVLVGGLGPRIPQVLASLTAGFYPAAPSPRLAHAQP